MRWCSLEFTVNDNLLSTSCNSTKYRDQLIITVSVLEFIIGSLGTQKVLYRLAAAALSAHTRPAKAEHIVL